MADEGVKVMQAFLEIDGKTEGADKAIDGIKTKAGEAGKAAETMGERVKQALEKIKEGGGKRSGLGELAETLMGMGAVAGVSAIGEALKDASEKAAKLSDEMREGNMSAAEMAAHIGEALPVLGAFVETGQSIREMFTHEKAAIEEVNKAVEAGNKLYEARKGLHEITEGGNVDVEDKSRGANNAMRSADAVTPIQKAEASYENNKDNREASYEQDQKAFKKAEQEKLSAAVQAVNERVKAEQKANTEGTEQEIAVKNAAIASQGGKEQVALEARTKKDIEEHNKGLVAASMLADEAAKKELDRVESGAEEQMQIRIQYQKKLAQTPADKVENFRAEMGQQHGFKGKALDGVVGAFKEGLQADAIKGTRDAMEGLNAEFRDSSATTFAQKLIANRAALEEQAAQGKITTESIDKLQEAFARNLHVQVANEMERAAVALSQVGETDLQKQVDALSKMGASTEEAAKYAKDLKDQLTGADVKNIQNQTATIGKNPLEAAGIVAAQKGEDPGAVQAATGQQLGAQMKESMETPMEALRKSLEYNAQMQSEGYIDLGTAMRANAAAYEKAGLFKTSDVATAAMDHLKSQFSGLPAMVADYHFKHHMPDPKNMHMPAVDKVTAKHDEQKKADQQNKNKDGTVKQKGDELLKLLTEVNVQAAKLAGSLANGVKAVFSH